jgi:hypothetical protein
LEVGDTQKFKRSFSITLKLKFAFAEAAASIETGLEAIRYGPQLFAAGLLTDTAIWTFCAPRRPGVTLLLKKHRGSIVLARFIVGVSPAKAGVTRKGLAWLPAISRERRRHRLAHSDVRRIGCLITAQYAEIVLAFAVNRA